LYYVFYTVVHVYSAEKIRERERMWHQLVDLVECASTSTCVLVLLEENACAEYTWYAITTEITKEWNKRAITLQSLIYRRRSRSRYNLEHE
jgi:hypothetical protein